MDGIRWDLVLAAVGVIVPIAIALYEYVVVGRKRLGYRVQMDTTAIDAVSSHYSGALRQLREGDDGEPLTAPSFVLLRIENNGATHIEPSDYAAPDNEKVGLRVIFPGRRVAGMVVTELSDEFLRSSFGESSGLNVHDNAIELPKVPLNRSAHYKVLAVLDCAGDASSAPQQPAPPKIVGGIKGGVGGGGMRRTRSRTGVGRAGVAMIGFLVIVIAVLFTVSVTTARTPWECASGTLTLTGSTAFQPVLSETAAGYRRSCPGAEITLDALGSEAGLTALDRSPGQTMVAFSDGPADPGQHPKLIDHPVANIRFTLVANGDTGVHDLSLAQLKALYAGAFTNWDQVGGPNRPVLLVSRHNDSGTRRTFEQDVLGTGEGAVTSDNCLDRNRDAPPPPNMIRCEVESTDQLLDKVAKTPGALGYSEADAASQRNDVTMISIDGQSASGSPKYPFGQEEYAYTNGQPPTDSLAASFLRYLTCGQGNGFVQSHDDQPIGVCQPT